MVMYLPSRRSLIRLGLMLLVTLSMLGLVSVLRAQTIPVRVDRWLEVRQVSGSVQVVLNGRSQTARSGQRMSAVGDSMTTGSGASAILAVDTSVGFVIVAENTSFRITQMRATSSGGRVTELNVSRGQVRLQTRPFTDPETRLEIQTPAGVSGVRGTVFGVTVPPDGRMGVATERGAVITSAQGQEVSVPAGFQNVTFPGEAPMPALPLKDDTTLDIRILRAVDENTVQVTGQIDPVNLLVVQDQTQTLDRLGQFDLRLPLSADRRIRMTVNTPLGNRQVYELVVP